jgi:hypothetical protein
MLSKIKYTAGVAKRLGYVPVKGAFPMPDRYDRLYKHQNLAYKRNLLSGV